MISLIRNFFGTFFLKLATLSFGQDFQDTLDSFDDFGGQEEEIIPPIYTPKESKDKITQVTISDPFDAFSYWFSLKSNIEETRKSLMSIMDGVFIEEKDGIVFISKRFMENNVLVLKEFDLKDEELPKKKEGKVLSFKKGKKNE